MRKQINVRVPEEFIDEIDEIRRMSKPVPTMSQVVIDSVHREFMRLSKLTEKQKTAA